MRGSGGAAVANITTAYINDIPGTGVKKGALADLPLPATAFVNNSRESNTRSTRTSDSRGLSCTKVQVHFLDFQNDFPV